MAKRIDRSTRSANKWHGQAHRFEHWYVDNQVYFLTARCGDRYPAFAEERAKAVFWDRFEHYTAKHRFTPWVTSLLDNHYHCLGYCKVGVELKTMMQRLHGSVAKLVNDLLPERRVPLWLDDRGRAYMDGCLRDAKQGRATYGYVLKQAQRHGIVQDYRDYPHTRVNIALDEALRRAIELGAFMDGAAYRRYEGYEARRYDHD